MVDKVKKIIRQRNPSLDFFNEIHKLIEKRWNKLNTSLHMAAYALNPKWYMERPNRVLPIDDEEVKHGFLDAINKMYTPDEANVLCGQFIDFGTLSPSSFTQDARRDIKIYAQKNPIGWWRMYGGMSKSFDNLLHACYLKFPVHQQLKGIGLLIVSSTLLRGIDLLLREQRHWFMCIVVFDFFPGSYLSI